MRKTLSWGLLALYGKTKIAGNHLGRYHSMNAKNIPCRIAIFNIHYTHSDIQMWIIRQKNSQKWTKSPISPPQLTIFRKWAFSIFLIEIFRISLLKCILHIKWGRIFYLGLRKKLPYSGKCMRKCQDVVADSYLRPKILRKCGRRGDLSEAHFRNM